MNIFYYCMEIFATLVECFVYISAITKMSGKRYFGSKHNIAIAALTIIFTVFVTFMNTWKTFSFVTLAVSFCSLFLLTRITSVGKALLRGTSCVLVFFLFNTLDYIVGYGTALIVGRATDIQQGLNIIIQTGIIRIIYILINKAIQIAVYFSLLPLYPKLKLLSNRYLKILFGITATAYIVMSSVTALIMYESQIILQVAVILSLLFVFLTIIATMLAITENYRFQTKRRENDMMLLTNTMLEKNYQDIQRNQDMVRQQMHDFKNHIRTINGMLAHDKQAKEYIEELLKSAYTPSKYCSSGNEVIDSVINCKQADAVTSNIPFTYQIKLIKPLKMAAIDICAILANQIDNALEACKKIENTENRFVRVSILQKDEVIFFKVENSAPENPFNDYNELITTKKDQPGLHGFGIKNIQEILHKYDGELSSSYENFVFTSIAMAQISE